MTRCSGQLLARSLQTSLWLFCTIAHCEQPLSFNKDIRPILASNCFECHGPDEAAVEAELRLDSFDSATADLGGYSAIVPGDPDASLILERITDHDDPMPPAKANKSVIPEQVAVLRRWIEQGAEYETHWAFEKPERPELPQISDATWPKNPIDHFVLARLDSAGLKPSPEADPQILVRRLFLDLIGLPPTPEQADAFVASVEASGSDAAVSELCDQLLQSPHYGERWARPWLDLARYSDTNGYEKDRNRSIWPYRDWVIGALNADMPYDQFSIEQLAGDMLPDATPEQIVATGFHRNTMINEEGGIDPMEFRYHALVDRVATTGTVWLGMTTGCAQCHTHKYDPITHTDYFALMALMDDADEIEFRYLDQAEAKRAEQLRNQILKVEDDLLSSETAEDTAFSQWKNEHRAAETPWTRQAPSDLKSNLPLLTHEGEGVVFASGDFTKRDEYHLSYQLAESEPVTAIRIETLPDPRLPEGKAGRTFYEGRKGLFFISEVNIRANGSEVSVARVFDDGVQPNKKFAPATVLDGDGSSGWTIDKDELSPHYLVLEFETPIPGDTKLDIDLLFERHFVSALGKLRISTTNSKGPLEAGKLLPALADALFAEEQPDQERALRLHYLLSQATSKPQADKIANLRKQVPNGDLTMVFDERAPDQGRTTQLRHRGEYLDPKQAVEPAIPELFGSLPDGVPANRLSLARWLVSSENPLGARVAINRAWLALFGRGIVETAADFGVQASAPSHPKLLDWLAIEFQEQGQSMKDLHRLLVTSATYRQSSDAPADLVARDPKNELLARAPRFRADGETVRDILLHGSDLLNTALGGPSVYPPQPASVTDLAYGNFKWPTSKGADRYRRSLYTFSKRTAPFAAFTVFDAPTGELCTARRARSNTPLQALTVMNDPMFIQMARHLGTKLAEEYVDDSATVQLLFRRFLTRRPTVDEEVLLADYLKNQRGRLADGQIKASEVMAKEDATNEAAAWTLAVRVVMNLDETITKN